MRCPYCDAETGKERETCPACGKPLAEAGEEWVEFVTVMTTRDHSELAVAKSLLEAAGIEFFARNEEVENLIAAGPVELQVRPEDEEEANALLNDLEERKES